MKPIGYELIRLNVYNFLHSKLSSKIRILNVFKSYTSINFPQYIKSCLFWTQRAAFICVKPATYLNSSFVSNANLEVLSVIKFFFLPATNFTESESSSVGGGDKNYLYKKYISEGRRPGCFVPCIQMPYVTTILSFIYPLALTSFS